MSRRLKIVLASTSPRRKELLRQLDFPFEAVDPGEVLEAASGRPEEVVSMNSMAKALRVAEGLEAGIVIGADTVVVKGGTILGKPESPSDVEEMLRSLRGSVHRVLTGIAVVDAESGHTESEVVETRVRMLPLSDVQIRLYVETGEPIGKAGGYAIQGLGAILIEEVHGCFYNVVGLPLSKLNEVLGRFDHQIFSNIRSRADPARD
ncbi:MAG: nucleoside triphosphate pyrophosphatase [Candidatus Bathyarchaeia archaeon]